MRLHHGRIYLLVGCNEACSIYARGHLNPRRGRRHLGLRSARTTLAAGRALRVLRCFVGRSSLPDSSACGRRLPAATT